MPLTIDERTLTAADDPSGEGKKDERSTAPGRLLDLMVLILSIDAYQLAGDDQDLINRGLTLYRQHRGSIEEAAAKHIETLMDRSDAGTVRAKYRLMEAVDPTKKARFVEDFLIWLKHRTTLMRDVFPGRAYTNAVKAAVACEEGDVELRLQKLSLVPTSSGMSAMFKWIRKAAEAVGAPAPTTEAIASQVEGAQGIIDEMRQVESQLSAEGPASARKSSLQDQKLDLAADLNEAIEESDDPPTVLAQAAGRLSSGSKTAAKFGLTPEQEQVMLAMGKVVIAAGAGSGKTQTLVATIAHLVEERGYRPEQIMACSFTRAASAELENRVENRAGIRGAVLGTTHHMAREIISRARPNLVQVVKNTKAADKLFKIALKQVPLDVGKFQQTLEANKDLLARIEAIPGWRNKDILVSFHGQLSRGKALSEKQLAVIKKFESGGGWGGGGGGGGYGGRPYRRYSAEEQPLVEAVRAALQKTASTPHEAAGSDPPGDDKFSPYWTTPVGEWFNIGKDIIGEDGKPMGEKRAKLAVENFKNGGMSVEQVRAERGDQDPIAALYGAYEWLKKNDPVMAPAMDYTDQLVVALEILKTDPKAREAEQRRHKVLLVDECQDLNQIQFEMFDILGEKADLYARIGDDKQSIYGFRGAKPETYVDATKQEGVQTKLMTMNFRSGKAIVDAANKLIAHNEDRQIPMVCNADVDRKGMGAIKAKTANTHEDGADMVAQEIKDAVDAGDSPKDFGILVRNNAEADAYTLSLLVRGIPYRMLKKSEGGYFGKPLVKAMTAWMRLIIGGSDAEVNDAVVEAHMTPGFNLDKMFASGLSRNVRGSYLDHIMAGNPVYFGKSEWMNKKYVAEYVNAIRTVRALGGGDSPSLIRAILAIKGTKGTFEDALLKLVDEDDVIEEEGAEGGEEALRNAAMAPLRPLMVMAENFKDPANLLVFIQKMKAANEKAQKKTPNDKDDWKEPAVLIGTVHGWKGLEAKHVYVCMSGGVFPNFKTDDKAAGGDVKAYDEERRLAYVAITRGENSVTVMSPQQSYLGKPAAMSRFVSEACIQIAGDPRDDADSASVEEDLAHADPKQTEGDILDPIESYKQQLRDMGRSEAEIEKSVRDEMGVLRDEGSRSASAKAPYPDKFAMSLIACMGGCEDSPGGQLAFDFEAEIPDELLAQLDLPAAKEPCGCGGSGGGGLMADGQPCAGGCTGCTCGGTGCKSATSYDYSRS